MPKRVTTVYTSPHPAPPGRASTRTFGLERVRFPRSGEHERTIRHEFVFSAREECGGGRRSDNPSKKK